MTQKPTPRVGTIIYHKALDLMSPDEGCLYLRNLKEQLTHKQQRERAYLDRRAQRGTHTPIDDAYAADQQLETELLALLERLLEEACQTQDAP